MIKHCYEKEKCKKVIIGSGGSAFVDGGIGAIHALDVFDFKLKNGCIFPKHDVPTVRTIEQLESADLKEKHDILENLSIVMPCDATNPLLGLKGASYVYGPQKGVLIDDC